MGIDKSKKIKDILESNFEKDPLMSDNKKENVIDRKSIPFKQNDVLLQKNQTAFASINNILTKLLQNDLFSERYMEKTSNYISSKDNDRIKQAFHYDKQGGGYPPDNKNIYEDALSAHVKKYHKDAQCKLSYVKSEYMESDCSNFDIRRAKMIFIKSYPENYVLNETDNITISNDFVTKMEFSDSPEVINPNNYINIAICNHNTGDIFRQTLNTNEQMNRTIPSTKESTYIYKEWLSGFKEFYIYVPTTFTFYQENVNGENIKENTTFIRLVINKRHFKLNHIYNVEICGHTLPLQIHRDKLWYFNDTIQPSLLRTLCMSDRIEENVYCIYNDRMSTYTMYFMCYGTDAQSIRIYAD